MAGVNKVILLGRLGKDPETRNTGNQSVTNFSMATSESYKDKATGEKKETTEWHNCQAWGAVGDIIAKYVKKGDNLYVEGKIKTRSWEKDGVTRYVTEVVVNTVNLIGGNRTHDSSGPASTQSQAPSDDGGRSLSDDLPF